jgi:hypothetical protein
MNSVAPSPRKRGQLPPLLLDAFAFTGSIKPSVQSTRAVLSILPLAVDYCMTSARSFNPSGHPLARHLGQMATETHTALGPSPSPPIQVTAAAICMPSAAEPPVTYFRFKA